MKHQKRIQTFQCVAGGKAHAQHPAQVIRRAVSGSGSTVTGTHAVAEGHKIPSPGAGKGHAPVAVHPFPAPGPGGAMNAVAGAHPLSPAGQPVRQVMEVVLQKSILLHQSLAVFLPALMVGGDPAQLLPAPVKLPDQQPRLAAGGNHGILQPGSGDFPGNITAVPGGAEGAGILPHLLQHRRRIHRRAADLGNQQPGLAQNPGGQLQPHLGKAGFSPTVVQLQLLPSAKAQEPPCQQSRQQPGFPVSAKPHHQDAGPRRSHGTQPALRPGDQPGQVCHAQHRRHGCRRHSRQIQAQTCQGCRREGASHRQHSGTHRAQI